MPTKEDFFNLVNKISEEVSQEFENEKPNKQPLNEKNNNSELQESATIADVASLVKDIKKTNAKKSFFEKKAKQYENIHAGHRERVRRSAEIDNELESFADHQILEYLLFFGIPRVDTNIIAHELLDRYGTLDAVLNTSKDMLLDVPQMTENAVALLHALMPIARRVERSRTKSIRYIKTTSDAVAVLKPYFFNRNHELLYLMCLDSNDRLVGLEKIADGDVNFTNFDIKKFTLAIAKYGASKVIASHNHPAGTLSPSSNDIDATKRIQMVLSSMNVLLVDHIIIAGDKHYSFYSDMQMSSVYKSTDEVYNSNIFNEYYNRFSKPGHKKTDYVLEKDNLEYLNPDNNDKNK